ncbi:MAG: peptidyl-prolyl cis-trans isomerase [Burkholderiales bacterium]|nr:peptidyl-prolyl cis-trans isomerase [Burkholderiales bacterium]
MQIPVSRIPAAVLLAAAAASMMISLPAPAQGTKAGGAPAKAATVNGVVIPQSRVDAIVRAQARQGVPDSPQLREAVRDRLVMDEIVSQEAARKGLTKNPDVQAQIDFVRQQVIVSAYRADFAKTHPVSDAQVKAEYDRIKASMGDKEYKARHILVDKEEEASEIIAKLKRGEKFEDLAKASKDPGPKDHGGELDWNSPAGYVKPFSDAMVKLDKGKYTETPVQTQFGWHVIRVDDIRPTKFPPLDEVKGQLTERLQQQALEKNLAELRAKAKVE